MQVEFFLRFEGLSLGLKYRQTKKGFGTIFRDRKTQIFWASHNREDFKK